MFVMQNLYDSWQINNILKIGCSGYNKPMTSCDAGQMAALEQSVSISPKYVAFLISGV
jgi:hypothetical protein